MAAAWIALARGEEAELRGLLRELAEAPDIGVLPDGTRSVESAVALLHGMTGYDGTDALMAAARRATELEDDEHSPWYATATFELGHAHYVLGDLDAAMQVLPKAAYSPSAYAVIRVFALGVMSMVAREQGNTAISRNTALEAMTLVDSHSLRHIPQASFAYTALGENEAETGNLDGGIAILDEGLHLRRTAAGLNPWPTIHHLLAMGRVLTSAGDLQRAQHLLDEAGQLMSRYPGVMDAMRRRLAAARSTLRHRHTPNQPLESLTPRELDVLHRLQGPASLTAIAADLFVSPNTVKTHAQALYRKLGATTRSEAVRIGRRRSLI